jgi:hypothetical protein
MFGSRLARFQVLVDFSVQSSAIRQSNLKLNKERVCIFYTSLEHQCVNLQMTQS